jgi:hypothetical protein
VNRFVNRFLAVQAEPVRIGSTHCKPQATSHKPHHKLPQLLLIVVVQCSNQRATWATM